MTAAELIEAFRAHGVELTAVDGTIRYRAPAGVMTPAAVAALRAAKTEVLALLNAAVVGETAAEVAAALEKTAEKTVVGVRHNGHAIPWGSTGRASRTETFLLQLVPIRIATGHVKQVRVVVRTIQPAGGFALVSTDQNELNIVAGAVPTGNVAIVPQGDFEAFYLHGRQPLYARGLVANTTITVITNEEPYG